MAAHIRTNSTVLKFRGNMLLYDNLFFMNVRTDMQHLIRACSCALLLRGKVVLVAATSSPQKRPAPTLSPTSSPSNKVTAENKKCQEFEVFISKADLHDPRSSGRRQTLSFDSFIN